MTAIVAALEHIGLGLLYCAGAIALHGVLRVIAAWIRS